MMNITRKVSVLIPIYGVELFIERCARSLFEQTFKDIEYVFVNDCTQDKSVDILMQVLKEYPNRIKDVKILEHEINKGLSTARNTALKAATGYYIMHVDSDDYLELNAVELLYTVAVDSGADVIICDNKCVYKDRTVVSKQVIPKEKDEYIKLLLSKKAQPSIWGKFFARDLYIRSGICSVDGLNYGEDYVLTPRLIYYANFIVSVNVPLYNYVLFNGNAYTKNISIKSIRDMIWANKVLDDFFTSIIEKERYRDALILSKLRTQTYLLKYSDKKNWEDIIILYPELRGKEYLLSFSDRILLNFARKRRFVLLRMVIRIGFWIKNLY